jgi:hypothetical protein
MNYFVSLVMYVNKLMFAELQAKGSADYEQIRGSFIVSSVNEVTFLSMQECSQLLAHCCHMFGFLC